jgi:hypothetical protein
MRAEMETASKQLRFEEAARLRDEIRLLETLDRRSRKNGGTRCTRPTLRLHEVFVAFSSEQRCTCPSCRQKRALLTSIYVAEEVCFPFFNGADSATIRT